LEVASAEETEILYYKKIPIQKEGLIDEQVIVKCDLSKFAGQKISFKWSLNRPGEDNDSILGIIGCPQIIDSFAKPERPNIILICSDTHRYDYSLAGGCSDYLPAFSRYATESFVFHKAFSNASWTVPSVVSVLTGLEPLYHGAGWRAIVNREIFKGGNLLPGKHDFMKFGRNIDIVKYDKGFTSIPEKLKSLNYFTACCMANGYTYLSGVVNDGFDITVSFRKKEERTGKEVNACTSSLIKNYPRQLPLFLYIHYMDVHDYRIGRSIDSLRSEEVLKKLYKKKVLEFDDYFAELLELLKETGLYDSSIIIFYSDHGENLYECRQIGHGNDMREFLLHIPLVFKLPPRYKAAPRPVYDNVQLIDIFPTIMDLIGAAEPASSLPLRGMSLKDIMLENKTIENRYIRSAIQGSRDELAAVRHGRWKYIRNLSKKKNILVDLQFPGKCDWKDFSGKNGEVAAKLKSIIDKDILCFKKYILNSKGRLLKDPNKKQLELLKSLGYIE
jgi:hypothetical protein